MLRLHRSTTKDEKGHSGLDPESLYCVEVIYMKCCGLDKEICNAETEMLNRVQHDNEQELGYKLIFGRIFHAPLASGHHEGRKWLLSRSC